MCNDLGVLYIIFILKVMVYLMFCFLMNDVEGVDMCGVSLNCVFFVYRKWYFVLLEVSFVIFSV